jgi:hypothetical protein
MADVFRVVVPVDPMDDQSWQLAVRYALRMAREGAVSLTATGLRWAQLSLGRRVIRS